MLEHEEWVGLVKVSIEEVEGRVRNGYGECGR